MQLTINRVGTTPVILILAIPSCWSHPSITPHRLVAVCCVICWLFHEVPPLSCHYPQIHVYIGTTFGSLTASPPLRSFPTISDDIQCIVGSTEPLKHSSGWLKGYFQFPTSYSAKTWCHDSKATATQPPSREPPTTAAPPPNKSAESSDEVDCGAAQRPLWMAAVHG